RGDKDADARQPGLHRAVRDRLERRPRGAQPCDPAGARPLCPLLAATDPRHHFGSGEMRVLIAGLGKMGLSDTLAHHHHPGAESVALVTRSAVALPRELQSYPLCNDFPAALAATWPE